MILDLTVDGSPTCQIQLFADKVPAIISALKPRLPLQALLQHAKLSGQMVFFTIPLVLPWQNYYTTEQGSELRGGKGHDRGAVCFYNPRQQLCIVYGDDLAAEPLGMSYIGEVVSGADRLEVVGMRTWLRQGSLVEISVGTL